MKKMRKLKKYFVLALAAMVLAMNSLTVFAETGKSDSVPNDVPAIVAELNDNDPDSNEETEDFEGAQQEKENDDSNTPLEQDDESNDGNNVPVEPEENDEGMGMTLFSTPAGDRCDVGIYYSGNDQHNNPALWNILKNYERLKLKGNQSIEEGSGWTKSGNTYTHTATGATITVSSYSPGNITWTSSFDLAHVFVKAGNGGCLNGGGQGGSGLETPYHSNKNHPKILRDISHVSFYFPTPTAPVVNPAISIEKTVDKSVVEHGSEVEYTIKVQNTGNVALTNVVVTDAMLAWTAAPITLAADAAHEYKIPYVFPVGTAPGVYTNTANVTAVYNTITVDGSDSADVEVQASPAISITKTVDPVETEHGTDVEYQITVENTGNVPLSNVVVLDDMLDVVWNVGQLAVGGTDSRTFSYSVATGTKPGPVDNVATVSGTYNDTVVEGTAEAVFTVLASPSISIVKTVDTESAFRGDKVKYTFTVINDGNVDLKDVVVTDKKLGKNWSWKIGTLQAGGEVSRTFEHTIPNNANYGDYINTAEAKGKYDKKWYKDTDTAILNIVKKEPAITIEKSVNKTEAFDGDEVIYTITVTNSGSVKLDNIKVSDPLLGLNYTINTLKPGHWDTREFTHNIPAFTQPGNYTNVANVTVKYDKKNLKDSDNAKVKVLARPSISLVKTVDTESAFKGDKVKYTFTVVNDGNVDLKDVVVTDPKLGSHWSWKIGTLKVGKETTKTFEHTIPNNADSGDYVNTATAKGKYDKKWYSDNDTATLIVKKKEPSISIVKTAVQQNVKPGETVQYAITVINSGNVDLKNVTVKDDLLGLNLSLGQLASGESIEVNSELLTHVIPALTPVGPYPNIASVSAKHSKSTVTDEDTAIVNVEADPSINIVKTVDAESAYRGDTVAYTFTVTNTGNVSLSGVAVADVKLGKRVFGVWVPYAWLAGSLEPGQTVTHTVNYTIPASASLGEFVNEATVLGLYIQSWNNIVKVSSKDEAVLEILADPFVANPSITLTKSASVETAEAGDEITYTLIVKNNGNVDLTNVQVTDEMLGELSEFSISSLLIEQEVIITVDHTIPVGTPTGPYHNYADVIGYYGDQVVESASGATIEITQEETAQPSPSASGTPSQTPGSTGSPTPTPVTVLPSTSPESASPAPSSETNIEVEEDELPLGGENVVEEPTQTEEELVELEEDSTPLGSVDDEGMVDSAAEHQEVALDTLPKTGQSSPWPYTIAGLMLLIAGAFLFRKKDAATKE